MRILEISPFLRIILRYSPIPRPIDSYSQDDRIFYVRRGSGRVYINGEENVIKPDTLLFWQRGTAYRFVFDGAPDVVSVNFDFTAENCAESASIPILLDTEENREEIGRIRPVVFEDCPVLNEPAVVYGAVSIWPRIKELLAESTGAAPYNEVSVSGRLKLCIAEMLRLVCADRERGESAGVQKVLDHIRANYRDDLTNEQLAAVAGYHPHYLNSMVREATGRTLHSHLVARRLEVAEGMLLSTDASVASIAEAVGFSGVMVFIRNFKIKNGMSPGRFRESAGLI